jgi:magnesium transporter
VIERWLEFGSDGVIPAADNTSSIDSWKWLDLQVGEGPKEVDEARALLAGFGFDPLAIDDAVSDRDLPKVDDFGDHLLVILHGLRVEGHGTYELDCFLTSSMLVTVRAEPSPAVDVMFDRVSDQHMSTPENPSELLGRLADLIGRGLQSVVEAFDDRIESLIVQALDADDELLEDLMAVRSEVVAVRRVVRPQREALDVLRHVESSLVTSVAMRRFADVFDVANRTVSGLDAARSSLAETLDTYRGAEARRATDVTMVLTVYAAVVLPLSLVAGFFGMNNQNIPGVDTDHGWIAVLVGMVVLALSSLFVFWRLGWLAPLGARGQATKGRGLTGVLRTPAQVAADARTRAPRRPRRRS